MLFCKMETHNMTNSSITFQLDTDKIRLLKELGEEKVAIKSADEMRDSLSLIYGKVDLDGAMSMIIHIIKRFGFSLSKLNGHNKKFVVQYDLDYKGILFCKAYIER